MENRRGKCINFGECAKADRKEIIELGFTEDFECPECQKELIEEAPPPPPPTKKILTIVAILAVLGGIGFGVYKFVSREKTLPTIIITPEKATIEMGGSVILTVTTEPENSGKKMIWNWTSGNENVATVNNKGLVTGKGEGSAVITVSIGKKGEVSASVTVTVEPPCAPVICKILEDMVLVQGGTFTMGCTSEQAGDCVGDERPTRQVTLSSFNINKYEITQAQWVEVMGSNPSRFKGDDLPVEMVSWNDVQDFIRKLNAMTGKQFRLPTEAEWEFAARGGSQSRGYKYSGSATVNDVAWYISNSGGRTRPVGEKQPNELGIYDMSGNVHEWCSDWYGNYSGSAQTDPQGPSSGSRRVNRGGSWDRGTPGCRVSIRNDGAPDARFNFIGFRLAHDSNLSLGR